LRNTASTATQPDPFPIDSKKLAQLVAGFAADKKAEDIVVLDLRDISSFTEFFLICSATSEPHLKAIIDNIEEHLRLDHNRKPLAVDGFPLSQWIVADYGEIVIHVFHQEKRGYYSLEDLWSDAPRLKLPKTA
jgi:ribosome-associated protein